MPTLESLRPRRMLPALAMLLLLPLALLLLSACGRYELRSQPIEPPMELADFTLTDHTGRSLTLSELHGKVVLLFFGYASCPDVCPTTLADLASLKQKLGADAEGVQVLFVTVDPKRDTQQILKEYVAKFHPSFIGLRGSQAQVEQILKDYGGWASRPQKEQPGHVHLIDHGGYVYVIDRQGRLRELFDPTDTLELMVSDVRYLVNE